MMTENLEDSNEVVVDHDELNNDELLEFIKRNYMKNRTFVTKDIPGILDDIESVTNLEVIRHKYATGDDCSTWIIPPQWDVNQAWLKDKDGNNGVDAIVPFQK